MGRMSTSDTSVSTHTADSAFEHEFQADVGQGMAASRDFETQPWAEEMADERPCNVGRTEQTFRLVAGGALLAAAAMAPVSRGWRIGFAVLGVAEIVTGAMRYCPVNQALGINTCRDEDF